MSLDRQALRVALDRHADSGDIRGLHCHAGCVDPIRAAYRAAAPESDAARSSGEGGLEELRESIVNLEDLRGLSDAATPIEGYPGYRVDAEGRVFSTTPWRGQSLRQLAAFDDGDGYLRVRLTVKGKRYNGAVHRLVCAAFHGPRPSMFHEVRHLNGVRYDNRAVNLAWGTQAENAADREAHGRTARGERNGETTLTVAQVAAIRTAYANHEADQYQLAATYGVHQTTISRIVRGESWT